MRATPEALLSTVSVFKANPLKCQCAKRLLHFSHRRESHELPDLPARLVARPVCPCGTGTQGQLS